MTFITKLGEQITMDKYQIIMMEFVIENKKIINKHNNIRAFEIGVLLGDSLPFIRTIYKEEQNETDIYNINTYINTYNSLTNNFFTPLTFKYYFESLFKRFSTSKEVLIIDFN